METTMKTMSVETACAQACRAIAPSWPLDRAIAVNPHWSRIEMPVRRVAARMAVLGGIQVFPPRGRQLQAWQEGRIGAEDLALALERVAEARVAGLSSAFCVDALESAPSLTQLPLLIDVLDDAPRREARLSWRQAITHQVSQACAAYFDEHQADWRPGRSQGLYAFWRQTLQHDHGIGVLMGLPSLGHALDALPATRQEAEHWVLQRLGLPPEVWADYLEAVLLTVNGWASWCAYLGWQAGLQGRQDEHLRELLAVRLAWGAILLDSRDDAAAHRAFGAVQRAWSQAPTLLAQAEEALLVDEVWQTALEIGYQRGLAGKLVGAGEMSAQAATTAPVDAFAQPHARSIVAAQPQAALDAEVQAAFCIDVRSEPMRRALESAWPAVQTIGFAGFFGVPLAYTPLGTSATRPQLPGLLAPALEITDHVLPAGPTSDSSEVGLQSAAVQARQAGQARQTWLGVSSQWSAATRWPGAAFSFVEAAGLGYLGKLGRWLTPASDDRARDDQHGLPARYRAVCRPLIDGLSVGDKVALAARVLHAMGLEHRFAPLVVLVGHGSQSHNDAHAAALDCGACCGQTGEVNARSLALLLNEAPVRAGLHAKGILIPEDTRFVAALHNTTTDEIEGFDLDLLPAAARARWSRLQTAFGQAGDQVRRERAPTLGLDPRADAPRLLDILRRRANDGAQTRPEWGLAGNAAFLIAPRARSRGLDLAGRCFLHDYDAGQDPDGSVLELLMTAPMLVTHWINWQYHASTCDPARLGSGNKLLHNVVGGTLGVFEGNGGDLRIGLSQQSLHDGERWVHEPLRLTVIIDAPRQSIERVVHGHEVVRRLVDNGWLHLWCLEGEEVMRYQGGTWALVSPRTQSPS